MFQKYRALFSKRNLLEKAFRRTVKMIEFDREMFEASVQVLRHSDESDMPFDIYEKDKALNKYEREVRRNVLTHLAVVGKGDIVAGLTLVSIVIDVERIGDYTKNIADLAKDHPKRLEGGRHEKALAEIENKITERFTGFDKIMLESDVKLARAIMRSHKELNEQIDELTLKLTRTKEKEIDPGDAVILALYVRYLKRINGHLTNIASSIVNPFHRIGYREKTKTK